jgi:hypothetical protein
MCQATFAQKDGENEVVRLSAARSYEREPPLAPLFTPFVAAGFFIGPAATVLVLAPFDPYLPFVFMGEGALLYSALLQSALLHPALLHSYTHTLIHSYCTLPHPWPSTPLAFYTPGLQFPWPSMPLKSSSSLCVSGHTVTTYSPPPPAWSATPMAVHPGATKVLGEPRAAVQVGTVYTRQYR